MNVIGNQNRREDVPIRYRFCNFNQGSKRLLIGKNRPSFLNAKCDEVNNQPDHTRGRLGCVVDARLEGKRCLGRRERLPLLFLNLAL